MKKKKLIPYAFLAGLTTLAIFIVGVQYGKHVAQLDKTIHFLVSITPSVTPSPKPRPSVGYELYSSKGCGVEFIRPSDATIVKESSNGATLRTGSKDGLTFICDKGSAIDSDTKFKDAKSEVLRILNKDVDASKSGSLYSFQIQNKKRQPVQFLVSESLIPLIEKTLTVTP